MTVRVVEINYGTAVVLDALTSPNGASPVIAWDTTNSRVRVFDGSTLGGIPLANEADGEFTLGSTLIALGATVTTVAGLTLSSPTFTTPTLGTPASGTLTNCTGLPVSTGISGLGAGVATFLATPSSANLASAVTGETGSGALVFGTSPTLTTPTISGSATFGDVPLITYSNTGTYVSTAFTGGVRAELTNTDTTTLNNMSRLFFRSVNSGATGYTAAALTAIHIGRTAASESADLSVQVRGGGANAERSRWYAGGDFRQGTGAAIATNATDGFFLVATCAGTPTGVPTNAGAGQMPMVYDSTNNELYVYNGSWRSVALT